MEKVRAAAYAKVERERLAEDISRYVSDRTVAKRALSAAKRRQPAEAYTELVEAWTQLVATLNALVVMLREELLAAIHD